MTVESSYKWPDWMPKPLISGFTLNPVERRKISEMEAGTMIRVEYDTDEFECQCSMIMDELQSAWFEAFEARNINFGSMWFEFPLWISGGIQYQFVRFKSRPKISQIRGKHTTYQMTFQVENRALWGADLVDIMLILGPDEFADFSNRLHDDLNENLAGETLLWCPTEELVPTTDVMERVILTAESGLREVLDEYWPLPQIGG